MAQKPAKKAAAGGRVKVKRVGSPLRREASQGATMRGLGLKRAGQIVELEDTPAVRGMIRKVAHLVEIVSSE
jgi:large subunit ribosomal protein L30